MNMKKLLSLLVLLNLHFSKPSQLCKRLGSRSTLHTIVGILNKKSLQKMGVLPRGMRFNSTLYSSDFPSEAQSLKYLTNLLENTRMSATISIDYFECTLNAAARCDKENEIKVSTAWRDVIDGILNNKPRIVTRIQIPSYAHVSIHLPTVCGQHMLQYILFHEAGHLYNNHSIACTKSRRIQEQEADAFAATTFDSLIGGVIRHQLNATLLLIPRMNVYENIRRRYEYRCRYNATIVNTFLLQFFSRVASWKKNSLLNKAQEIYYQENLPTNKDDIHPSPSERFEFFEQKLSSFLEKNPAYKSRYEHLMEQAQTIKIHYANETYNLFTGNNAKV